MVDPGVGVVGAGETRIILPLSCATSSSSSSKPWSCTDSCVFVLAPPPQPPVPLPAMDCCTLINEDGMMANESMSSFETTVDDIPARSFAPFNTSPETALGRKRLTVRPLPLLMLLLLVISIRVGTSSLTVRAR